MHGVCRTRDPIPASINTLTVDVSNRAVLTVCAAYPNVRFWLLADIPGHEFKCPLLPRKRTFGGLAQIYIFVSGRMSVFMGKASLGVFESYLVGLAEGWLTSNATAHPHGLGCYAD